MTMEQRAPLFKCPIVEMTSLNGGSTSLGDAVYANSLPDILYCATIAAEKKIVPEYEVFEIGMIQLDLPARILNQCIEADADQHRVRPSRHDAGDDRRAGAFPAISCPRTLCGDGGTH